MNGFFYPTQNQGRLPFLNVPNVNPYLSPIGTNQISDYKNKGIYLDSNRRLANRHQLTTWVNEIMEIILN